MNNLGFITYYEAKQKLTKELEENIKNKIMIICEDHKIRLTPKEYNELIKDYINDFIENISVSDLIRLSENVQRRNS